LSEEGAIGGECDGPVARGMEDLKGIGNAKGDVEPKQFSGQTRFLKTAALLRGKKGKTRTSDLCGSKSLLPTKRKAAKRTTGLKDKLGLATS